MSEQPKRVTVPAVRAAKSERKLGMITAYDHPSSRIADQAGADIILVGDSLAMVVLGHPDTLSVTMEEMLHHTRAAARGASHALVVGDMPWLSYHLSASETVRNAGEFIRAGAQAVKIEGGRPSRIAMVRAILDAEIPVMGHIGLTPQSVHAFGGFKVQGRGEEAARRLLEEAIALDEAGCFAIVLECVPSELAAWITENVSVPTIGIGAGPGCDGQVLVFHDVLGLYEGHQPKFVRRYAEAGTVMQDAIEQYLTDVRECRFPDNDSEAFHVESPEDLRRLYASIGAAS
ncbi:MAG: 3-methyl-2-oxobutanoate hydroxymethyltransferase [Thermoanaerobaculia bacterium]